jgi:DNA-binding CsgD family transcriptional regulator
VTWPDAPGIVARDDELASLRAIADPAHGPRAALIRGEAGMGKTSLWLAATAWAADRDVRILSASGIESETPLALAALADLLDDVVPAVANRLSVAQRHAIEAALGQDTLGVEDPLILPRAVLTSLRLLGEAGPVLVAIDDAHWIDAASARIMGYVLRRLGDRPVATLATIRGGLDAADPLLLADAYGDRLEVLDLAPLGAPALQTLLRSRLGVRLTRSAIERVQLASGGNPMFAIEFATRIDLAGSQAAPLTVPPSLDQLVRERIGQLPTELLPLLELVAVIDRPSIADLGRGLDGADRALQLVELAAGEDIVVVDEQDVVRFKHPLLASAIYDRLLPPRRRALHRRAAELVDELEARARHLALASDGPDVSVAELLDQAAVAASRRGVPDAAAEIAEQALRLTGEDDGLARDERLLALGRYLAESLQTARAARLLDELLEHDLPDALRADALVLRALVASDVDDSAAQFLKALRYCGDNPALRVRVLQSLAEAHVHWFGDLVEADSFVQEARVVGESVDNDTLHANTLKWASRIASLRGLSWRETSREAIELEHGAPPPLGQSSARICLAQQLTWAGELDSARTLTEESLAELARLGREFDRSWQLPMLVSIELLQGEWSAAARHIVEVEELIDPEDAWGQAALTALRAEVAAYRGSVEEARRWALEALAFAERANLRLSAIRQRWVLGFLELSRGEPAHAWEWMASVPDELEEIGIHEPGFLPALPDAIEIAVQLGDLPTAERLLEKLDARARQLEHRWAIPTAARSRSLVLLASGETDAAASEADRAAAGFETHGFPLDQARSLLVAGRALRRAGQRRHAATALGAAAEIFTRLGAELWLEQTRAELSRANPRPRRDHELTHAEDRVAQLVATGRTNAEVAAQLYVTVATVEAHLTRIYRKLNVRSRVELAHRLASADPRV